MNDLSGIKAVSFDVDRTLWDFDGVMRRSLCAVLKELRVHDSVAAEALSVGDLVAARDSAEDELRGLGTDLNQIRRESFRRALIDVGRSNDLLAGHLGDVYFEHRLNGVALFLDVLPTLRVLRHGYTLGVISNGNSYLDHFGLDGLMSFGVYAQDYDWIEKPDSRIFDIAVDQAGCMPQEMVHVGDSLENDVWGASNAGLQTIWINREGTINETDAEVEISSLEELIVILQ